MRSADSESRHTRSSHRYLVLPSLQHDSDQGFVDWCAFVEILFDSNDFICNTMSCSQIPTFGVQQWIPEGIEGSVREGSIQTVQSHTSDRTSCDKHPTKTGNYIRRPCIVIRSATTRPSKGAPAALNPSSISSRYFDLVYRVASLANQDRTVIRLGWKPWCAI